jgi:superfamily II DNA or RNA helicase
VTQLPSGLYEKVITGQLEEQLSSLAGVKIQRELIEAEDAPELLARYVGSLTRQALRAQGRGGEGANHIGRQIETVNRVVSLLGELAPEQVDTADLISTSRELLLAIAATAGSEGLPGGAKVFPLRPNTPLSASALLVNRGNERILHALRSELASADEVDLICAFLKWSGVRLLREPLAELVERGGRLRIITTTYLGASDLRAIDELARLGAAVKISYETQATRLHAKAWHFHRQTGFSTAYVGSSNMSGPALTDGVEWNVRLSAIEAPHLIEAFADNFSSYWEDASFEAYDVGDDAQRDRLREALSWERLGPKDLPIDLVSFDIVAQPHQQQVLDELEAERDVHQRHRNLIVMATGTGKTVVAALDYRRLAATGTKTLLFVAHREEILTKSLSTFRHVLKDQQFGELLAGSSKPKRWRHVFASIQSLARLDLVGELPPDHFDVVVVDEFHHASAKTYTRLLNHVTPQELLGLTATPERADGNDITRYFDGRTAVDLRLWEAIDRGLLVPFQYFGINDETDLARVKFSRATGYDSAALTSLYTGDDARIRLIIKAVENNVEDWREMRALGFCVSIAHAEFMAAKFNHAGIKAAAVTSRSSAEDRSSALERLRAREVNALFTVDLFNEGIDLPSIDTILMLRPTESATVFLQQLGRGLRRAPEKASLTVLDFIGSQHVDFRFEPKIRALAGGSHQQAIEGVKLGFPVLPSGCDIQFDRVARQTILANLATSLSRNINRKVSELRQLGDVSLARYLAETGQEVEDVYRPAQGTWTGLREAAGLEVTAAGPHDSQLESSLRRILHIDDTERLDLLTTLANGESPGADERARRLLAMVNRTLWKPPLSGSPAEQSLQLLIGEHRRVEELRELIPVLRDRLRRVAHPVDPHGPLPLHVHARYSRVEAEAAFGGEYKGQPTGVSWLAEQRADLFFVDLEKSERHRAESTRYADRVITPTLFQWESQNSTRGDSVIGQRYINHEERGTTVHLFVRERKKADGKLGAPSFCYLGPARYVTHTGDKPMRIHWRLEHAIPLDLFSAWRVLTA